YMFLQLEGLPFTGERSHAEIEFRFGTVPEDLPPVSARNLHLNCVPIVNLFDHDADPIRILAERSEYEIRPSGDPGHHEVYTVESVTARRKGTTELLAFEPVYRFRRSAGSAGHLYEVRPIDAIRDDGSDHMLSLSGGDPAELAQLEALSLELVCTNRSFPDRLGLGDIHEPASTAPTAFSYRNITRPTTTIPAPAGADVHWQLLAHLSLNYRSLLDVESLRALLGLYDFRARSDRQARRQLENRTQAILAVEGRRGTLMSEGVPLRGIRVTLRIDEDRFGGEGEVFLFGTVFCEFLAECVTLNSFSELSIDIVN